MEQKTETKLKAIRKADGDWLKVVQDRNLVKLASYYHDDATWLLPGELTLTGKEAILGR